MKIYNKIVLEWNEETQHYDKVVHEDSFEYEGEVELAQHSCDCPGGGGMGQFIWTGGSTWPYGYCDYSYCPGGSNEGSSYGSGSPGGYGSPSGGGIVNGCTDPDADNYYWLANTDDGSCYYGSPDGAGDGSPDGTGDGEDGAYYAELNAYNCNPGELYIDSDSQTLKYCPGGGGALGDPLSEYRGGGDTWGETSGVSDVWTTYDFGEAGGEMDPYDIFGGGRNIFDVLPENVLRTLPPQYWSMIGGTYDISQEIPSWETFGGNVRGLQSGTRTERRNIQETLRGMNLGGGVSQTFAGGGGGVMPGREKTGAMASFQDFLSGQSADLAGYELGFGEDVTGMRQHWEDLVSGNYANVLAGGETQYCNCAPGYVCVGMVEGEEQCVLEGDVDWNAMNEVYMNPDTSYYDYTT